MKQIHRPDSPRMSKDSSGCSVYALIDAALLRRFGLTLPEVGAFLQQEGISLAQYRDKESDDAEVAAALETLKKHYRGTLIVNDRLGLAELADGLHLGQEDLTAFDEDPRRAVRTVRERLGRKLFGLSTHNADEILRANTLDLDYIGLGAYRPTRTKKVTEIGGESLLEIARLSRHPVAIIGGVRWEDDFDAPIRYKVLGSALFERITAQ